jgi:phage tail-like protein
MSDPALGLRFEVVIDDVELGAFTECEGLAAEYEIHEYEEGGQNSYVHKLPGRLKFPTIRLTRAVDEKSKKLAKWFTSVQGSGRKTGSITALNSAGEEVARWQLIGIYPARWIGPSFSVLGGAVAKESLELAHNGFM